MRVRSLIWLQDADDAKATCMTAIQPPISITIQMIDSID